MRKGRFVAAALAVVAAGAVGGYFAAKDYGESRLRESLDWLVGGAASIANIQYGAIAFDPLARQATIDDIAVSWPGADLKIGRVVLSEIGFGRFDPMHGRIALNDVTDRGLLDGMLGWIAFGDTRHGFAPAKDPWPAIRYDLALDYDVDEAAQALTVRDLAWSAPQWGMLRLKLDLANLPELSLPALGETAQLDGPVLFLQTLLAQHADLGPVLIRGAALSYSDQGAINHVLDGLAARTLLGDPQRYFLDLRDTLKGRIASGRGGPWDPALLDLLLGKARVEASAAPKSPVPFARVLRLPEDAAGTAGALGLKIAATGQRDLGHFAISEDEELELRAQPYVEAGQRSLALPEPIDKFVALSAFQQAAEIDPRHPDAAAGIRQAIAALLAEGAKREQKNVFFGDDGAVALYRKLAARAPDSAEAQAALAAMPQHLAAAALVYAETPDGVMAASAYLRAALRMNAEEPAVIAAVGQVADLLVKQGDRVAGDGAYLSESGQTSALLYYCEALRLQPDNAAAQQALGRLAEPLKTLVAQQVTVGDTYGAGVRVAAIEAQWPEVPGKAELTAALAALLAPPMPSQVAVYNWSDYIGEFTNQRFHEQTGISVLYDVFDSNETLEAKLLAGGSGYDVVVPSGAFLAQQIEAGRFRKLDKAKLPHLANLDPAILKASEAFDPGHAYSVPYMWGTLGIGYNVAAIKKRMPNAPLDSWRLVLDPKVVAKFKDCGVAIVDAPGDVLAAVLAYLGRDANSDQPEDYAAAQQVLQAVKPSIRYFHPSNYLNDIGSGEICLAIGWNFDFDIAQARAAEAHNGVKLRYVVPKEGTLVWVDNLAIPADAPRPAAALAYIDYLLDAQVAANNANYVRYASPNRAALEQGLINEADRNNPALYPPPAVMAKLTAAKRASPEVDRLRHRIWSAIKAGP